MNIDVHHAHATYVRPGSRSTCYNLFFFIGVYLTPALLHNLRMQPSTRRIKAPTSNYWLNISLLIYRPPAQVLSPLPTRSAPIDCRQGILHFPSSSCYVPLKTLSVGTICKLCRVEPDVATLAMHLSLAPVLLEAVYSQASTVYLKVR